MKQVRAVLALSLAACSTWRAETGPTPEVLPADKPRAVRLSLNTGTRVELYDAVLVGDGVVGFTRGPARQRQRLAVATSEIRLVEFLKTDVARTVLAVTVIAAVVLVMAAASAVSSAEPSGESCQTSSYSRPGPA